MKIAIASDLHDNLFNLNIFLKMLKEEKIKKIIFCGDLTNSETLENISANFKGEIIMVRGNVDMYSEEEINSQKRIHHLGRYGFHSSGNFEIGICHEPEFIKNLFQEKNTLSYIFYGHTHKPWKSQKNKAKLINPGALEGGWQKASFAIWDDQSGAIKLKLIDNYARK
jgi:uncharacterized protein